MTQNADRLARTLKALETIERIGKLDIVRCQSVLVVLQQEKADAFAQSDLALELTGSLRQIEKTVSRADLEINQCMRRCSIVQSKVLRARGFQNILNARLVAVRQASERIKAAMLVEDHVQTAVWQKLDDLPD
jgi:hypothetical protein